MTIHLRSVALRPGAGQEPQQFPLNVPAVQSLTTLTFSTPVTFFVGENGSGKSTLLEGIACAAGAITVGSESVTSDPSMAALRPLARRLHLSWARRTRKGFFLRAEDFFGFARRLAALQASLEADRDAVEREYAGRSALAADLARMPYNRELHALKSRYGEGLDSRSHGESFLALFHSRFVPGGLYLLDEPEAALSPARQLVLLGMLKQMVEQEAQFLIATHSPILMALPGALLLSFDSHPIAPVPYEALEHVQLTRAFLNNPDSFLRHL